ncbi:MAG: response regulator [Sphingomicrobium sp.]
MGRIILAEDDPISGMIASAALMDAGHAVGWLKDGSEVLAALIRRPPNLAILDCNMPGMSGVMVLREMRRRVELCEVPVLMLTARTSDSDERIARFAGADEYLTKPFDLVELVQTAEELMGGRRRRLA